jgi:hypothetical protein
MYFKGVLMKNIFFVFLITAFALNLYAQIKDSNTLKAPPSTSSGIVAPAKIITKSNLADKPNSNTTLKTTPTACSDSGLQGNKCGIEGVAFCKQNPQAISCQGLINENNTIR